MRPFLLGRGFMSDCTYCGDLATQRDHIIPVSYSHGFRVFSGTAYVPACAECNGLLGNQVFSGVVGKAAFLAPAIRMRHAKVLSLPDWSVEEVAVLSEALRGSLRERLALRERIRGRLTNVESVAAGGVLPPSVEAVDDHARHRLLGLDICQKQALAVGVPKTAPSKALKNAQQGPKTGRGEPVTTFGCHPSQKRVEKPLAGRLARPEKWPLAGPWLALVPPARPVGDGGVPMLADPATWPAGMVRAGLITGRGRMFAEV